METIQLTHEEREELNRWARGQSHSAGPSRRARLILLIEAGERFNVIRSKLDCDTNFIARWNGRFLAQGVAGLFSRHVGRAPDKNSERKEARILRWTIQKKPADGSTHWSQRKLAKELGGRAPEEIIDLAQKTSDNIVAMSTHGRSGMDRWVLGSVTDRVVSYCGDPVLLIRPKVVAPESTFAGSGPMLCMQR